MKGRDDAGGIGVAVCDIASFESRFLELFDRGVDLESVKMDGRFVAEVLHCAALFAGFPKYRNDRFSVSKPPPS